MQAHTILTNNKYFFKLTMMKAKVNIISSSENLIKGFEKTNIILFRGQNSQLITHCSLVNQRQIF